MLKGLLLLLACQLAGEAVVHALGLPIPGPVLGLALLAALLVWRPALHGVAGSVAGTLLSNLSLLFVPAAVGVVQVLPLLAAEGVAIGVALVGSTLLSLVVTALTFRALARAIPAAQPGGKD